MVRQEVAEDPSWICKVIVAVPVGDGRAPTPGLRRCHRLASEARPPPRRPRAQPAAPRPDRAHDCRGQTLGTLRKDAAARELRARSLDQAGNALAALPCIKDWTWRGPSLGAAPAAAVGPTVTSLLLAGEQRAARPATGQAPRRSWLGRVSRLRVTTEMTASVGVDAQNGMDDEGRGDDRKLGQRPGCAKGAARRREVEVVRRAPAPMAQPDLDLFPDRSVALVVERPAVGRVAGRRSPPLVTRRSRSGPCRGSRSS